MVKSNTGKDVLSIEMLQKLQVNFQYKKENVKKFEQIEKKQKMIDKLQKEIFEKIKR